MVSYTSAAAQIASAIKATLDTFHITRVDQVPTNRSIIKLELCNMAAAIKSAKTGGKYGHMYIILDQEEYRQATSNSTATVDMLTKPDDVNPKFKTEKKEDLTRYRIRGSSPRFAKISNAMFDPKKCSDMFNSLT